MGEPRIQLGGNFQDQRDLVLNKSGCPKGETRYGLSDIVDITNGEPSKFIRVYPDGIRVGCTFITKNAVAHVLAMAKERWGEIV